MENRLIEGIIELCREEAPELNRLDGLQGDGDMGITVGLMADALTEVLPEAADLKSFMKAAGNKVRRMAPSTLGVLTAFALTAASRVLPEGEVSVSELAAMQKAMADEMSARGGASEGDRTVLDALIPAARAFGEAADAGKTAGEALSAAAEAAAAGAEATRKMSPKTGRASWVGERVIGEIDGGAYFCGKIYGRLHAEYGA